VKLVAQTTLILPQPPKAPGQANEKVNAAIHQSKKYDGGKYTRKESPQ
jgi:hypothetical protein